MLIVDVYIEEGVFKLDFELCCFSIVGSVLLDGFWFEGGVIGEIFYPGELFRVGLESIGVLIYVDFKVFCDVK